MILPRPVLGVVFDMDGLLVDTETIWRDAQMAESEARGHPLPLEVVHSLIGLPWEHSQLKLRAYFGEIFDAEEYLEAAIRRVIAIKHEGVALKAGVIEMLDLLDQLKLPRAIATSSTHEIVQEHMGQSGLLPRFHAVMARGDYERAKPNPDPYLRAAEAIGIDPADCLALEDSHMGVRAAHAAGMMTVMVPDLLEATDEMHSLCVAVAETLHDVREALQRQV
jgi:HAD superfamily hydrolase (TIGR01509 family)